MTYLNQFNVAFIPEREFSWSVSHLFSLFGQLFTWAVTDSSLWTPAQQFRAVLWESMEVCCTWKLHGICFSHGEDKDASMGQITGNLNTSLVTMKTPLMVCTLLKTIRWDSAIIIISCDMARSFANMDRVLSNYLKNSSHARLIDISYYLELIC